MEQSVRFELDDGIGTVTIDRPEARNILTPDVVTELAETLSTLEAANCLVLQGAGETFCAGGAIDGVVEHTSGNLSTAALLGRLEAIDDLIEQLATLDRPTIAAVDGPAFGAGAMMALACDLTVASQAGSIGFGFKRVGLAPGAGCSYLLPQTVRPSTARDLVFTGELLDADRAARLGLFDRVYPAPDFQRGIAENVAQILDADQAILGATKRLLAPDREALQQAMQAEREAQRTLLTTPGHQESVEQFLEDDPEYGPT